MSILITKRFGLKLTQYGRGNSEIAFPYEAVSTFNTTDHDRLSSGVSLNLQLKTFPAPNCSGSEKAVLGDFSLEAEAYYSFSSNISIKSSILRIKEKLLSRKYAIEASRKRFNKKTVKLGWEVGNLRRTAKHASDYQEDKWKIPCAFFPLFVALLILRLLSGETGWQ